jgi:NAD(P)-dependent dehydrogenase (short-subunit alcohol dehydrogenase family)
MRKLDGKVAVVSGSGRGIGAEIARKLAAVVVNDLDEGPARETATAITAAGGQAEVCAGDITQSGFAERFTRTAVDRFGGLDIVVNNAGYTWDSVIQKMTDDQWDAILDVHLKAPFRILRAAQPIIAGFVKQAAARGEPVPCRKVVNISSLAGQADPGARRRRRRDRRGRSTNQGGRQPESAHDDGADDPAGPRRHARRRGGRCLPAVRPGIGLRQRADPHLRRRVAHLTGVRCGHSESGHVQCHDQHVEHEVETGVPRRNQSRIAGSWDAKRGCRGMRRAPQHDRREMAVAARLPRTPTY